MTTAILSKRRILSTDANSHSVSTPTIQTDLNDLDTPVMATKSMVERKQS